MFRVIAVLAAVIALACQSGNPTAYRQAPVQEGGVSALVESTVQVKVICDGELTSWGSGVIIDNAWPDGTTVATAQHVPKPGCTLSVRDKEFKVVAQDKDWDIAILRGPRLSGRAVSYSRPRLGQHVRTVGYPFQRYTGKPGLQVTGGEVSALFPKRYKVSTPAWFGSSGGPVFDDQGALIGLVVELFRGDGEYFATPAWKVFEVANGVRFTRHFAVNELACRCGVPVPHSLYPQAAEITRRAQVLRDALGYPLTVVSGYRTVAHNEKVGGAPRSYHLTAAALDLRSYHFTAEDLATRYEDLIASGEVPDGGLGVYRDWIHIDTGPRRRWRGQ